MDVIRPRAISAREIHRGCNIPFVASCMTIHRPGTGSRQGRPRGPSQKPRHKFADVLKEKMAKRPHSDPADPARKQESNSIREGRLTPRSGKTNAEPRETTQSRNRRVLLEKRTDKMSDEESKTQDQQISSSSKAYRPRQHSSSSNRPPQGSLDGTPKRTRRTQPQEDSHQAKKPNISPFESRDESVPIWT